MVRQQIKIITTRTDHPQEHANKVNEFLAQAVEVVNIQNEVHSGSAWSKYSRAEIVTIITYKSEV